MFQLPNFSRVDNPPAPFASWGLPGRAALSVMFTLRKRQRCRGEGTPPAIRGTRPALMAADDGNHSGRLRTRRQVDCIASAPDAKVTLNGATAEIQQLKTR